MAKSINEKIEAARLEKEQAEARIKQLLQQQKAQERKARIHRFCKRGGLMEKLLPDLTKLTDEQFQTFVEKTLLTPFTNRILNGLLSTTDTPAIEQGRDTATQNAVQPVRPPSPAKQGSMARNAS